MFIDLVNDIKQFFNNHKMVNNVDFGNIADINPKIKKFPMVFINPIQSQLNKFSFNIYCFTLYEQDRSNLEDSLNDTFMILNDFVNYFDMNYTEMYSTESETITLEPFTAKFDDYTNGWVLNITFNYNNIINNCDIPD